MRLRWPLLLSALLAISIALPAAGIAKERQGDFFVPTGARGGFGPFEEGPHAAAALRRAFGPPTSEHSNSYQHLCELNWSSLGIHATLVAYGSAVEPCGEGTFVEARLADPRWHTASGVHPGGPKGAARRASLRNCTRHKVGCGLVTGYVLELHQTDCASILSPGVIAHTRGARVVSLVVFTRGCE
jgi:hypothetical protein